MRTNVTLTRSKVNMKVTELLKIGKLHFSICSAILAWSSKLMVDYDSMGPSLQLVGAPFLNFKLRGLSILQEIQKAISVLLLKGHGRVCW